MTVCDSGLCTRCCPRPCLGTWEPWGGTSPAASGSYLESRASGRQGPSHVCWRTGCPFLGAPRLGGGPVPPPLGISGWLHLVGWLPGTANPARRWAHARGWGPAEAVLTPAASLRELEGDRVPLRLAGHRLTHCPPSSFVPEDLRPCLAKNVMTEEIKILYSLSVPFLK